MKDGRYLLDSSIVVDLDLFRKNKKVIQKIGQAEEVYASVIGLGELYYGAHRSTKPDKHFLEVDNLKRDIPVLECTTETASIYARIKNELRKKGTPIPENDIWMLLSLLKTI